MDVSSDAKEIPSLLETQKPKRGHRSWLTLDNLIGGLDNETLVGDQTPDKHEYEIDPSRVKFQVSTVTIDWLKYCRITRENGTTSSIAPGR